MQVLQCSKVFAKFCHDLQKSASIQPNGALGNQPTPTTHGVTQRARETGCGARGEGVGDHVQRWCQKLEAERAEYLEKCGEGWLVSEGPPSAAC